MPLHRLPFDESFLGTVRISGGPGLSFEVHSEGERNADLDAQRTSRSTGNGNI